MAASDTEWGRRGAVAVARLELEQRPERFLAVAAGRDSRGFLVIEVVNASPIAVEGDPIVKARLRQIRVERARQRMMAAVPEADVVIANPSHFAVALSYELGSAGAPRVTAKGVDSLALRIRALAEDCDVPVVENPPLARALHDGVELDQEIPPEHYKAVAEIIGYVMRLKGKLPARHAT